jgi:hypothetical protein
LNFILRKNDDNRAKVLENALREVAALSPYKTYTVVIKDKEETRSKQQNSYFHVLRDIIADETGQDKEDLKKRLKMSVLGYDKHTKKGETFYVLRETSDLTKSEFINLIDATLALALDLNISVPSPSYYGY